MISLLFRLVITGLVALAAPAGAGEKLVYAVVHKGSDFQAVRTDIFAFDPETAERHLIFSDDGTSILLIHRLYVFHFPVVGGGKLFAHAAQRGESVPFPGNASLYELSTDGSSSFRRITTVIGDESLGEIFASPEGDRIGYVNRLKRKQYIFINDVETGEQLRQVDMTEVFLDCYVSSVGWLVGSDSIFFSLTAGDAHITSDESYERVGSYVMEEDGEGLTKLDPVPNREGFWPPQTVRLIGVLPTGEYLYETAQQRKRSTPRQEKTLFAIVKANPDSAHVKEVGFGRESQLYSGIQVDYRLSPSGKYLAAAALPISSSAVSADIWLKDLSEGEERKLLSIPTKGLEGPFVGIVGWLD